MATHTFQIDRDSDPEWIIVHGVPILDEHRLLVPENKDEGKPARVVDINEGLLTRLAANNNRIVHETGDWVPLTEGHTTDDGPESSQPEILGYADQFHVGPLFNTNRKALLARFRISKDPDKLKKAANLPRRSVELWLDREEVNPISLLGATAPERNLGLLRLHRQRMFQVGQLLQSHNTYRDASGKLRFRQGRQAIRFNHDETTMQPAPVLPGGSPNVQGGADIPGTAPAQVDPALVQAVVSALQQTDVWQQMTAGIQQMNQTMQMLAPLLGGMGAGQPGMGADPMAQPGAGAATGGGMGDPLAALMAQLTGGSDMGDGTPGAEQPEEEKRAGDQVKLQAQPGQMGIPGPAGMLLPQLVQPQPTTSDRTILPPTRMQMSNHTQHCKPGESLEQAIIRLASERDEAIRFSRQAQVSVELAALQQEGLVLDPAEELPELIGLDDNARMVRYQRMRVRYQKRTQPTQQLPQQPQLPQLNSPVGVHTPTIADQATTQQQTTQGDKPMTREERDAVLDFTEQLRVEHERQGKPFTPPLATEVLRYLRSGAVTRLSRNGTPERVF